jgi:hypothetical protein
MRLTWHTGAYLPLQLLLGVTAVVSADVQSAGNILLGIQNQ